MIARTPLLILLVIWLVGAECADIFAQEVLSSTTRSANDSNEALIQAAVEARDANASKLKSAFGLGRLRYVVNEADGTEPVTVLDADLQIFYDEPKYRVHLLYESKMIERVKSPQVSEEDFEKWTPSPLAEQVIVYDGNQILSLECDRNLNCEGTIYFGFAKMQVMRNAGFPFEDPVTLWSQALHLEGLDLKNTSLTPLDDGGFVGQLTKNTYRMKFFLLDKFGYDLRRVSSYRTGETQPFRDYLLEWDQSNGVHFVRRYTNIVTSANRDTGSSVQTARKLSVEYDRFTANIAIDPTVFTLSSIEIPDGTQFMDKRSTVDGGPKQLIYRNGMLQDPSLLEASPVEPSSTAGAGPG